MGASFPRELRVRDRRDFQRVSRVGRRASSPLLVVLVAPLGPDAPPAGGSRLGVTVSRRVGGSVVRNRVKRQLREWFRRAHGRMPAGRDLVVIARPSAGTAARRELRAALERIEDQLCGSLSRGPT